MENTVLSTRHQPQLNEVVLCHKKYPSNFRTLLAIETRMTKRRHRVCQQNPWSTLDESIISSLKEMLPLLAYSEASHQYLIGQSWIWVKKTMWKKFPLILRDRKNFCNNLTRIKPINLYSDLLIWSFSATLTFGT